MANHVVSRLHIEADSNTESIKSLESFINKARQITHIRNPDGWWGIKEVSIGENKFSYIETHLDMAELLPPPEWIQDYYNQEKKSKEESEKVDAWYRENYGGPRFVFDDEIIEVFISYNKEDFPQQNCFVEYHYETKWSPNLNFIQNISSHYPTLRFIYNFYEDSGFYRAKYIIKNGERECAFFCDCEDNLVFDSENKYREFYTSIEHSSIGYKLCPEVCLPQPSDVTFIDDKGRHYVIEIEIDKQQQLIVYSWEHYDYRIAS